MSSAKIGIPGLEYAYIGDKLSFGEGTPDYLCTFYTGSFLHMGDPGEETRDPEPHGNPSSFPPLFWPPKEVGEPDNGSRKHCPKRKF